ncbi:alpha/beta hydrolase family protein [Winogradskyella sp.]|uniref:alpha/beta hydrolase family protein n=1 Tax=Winogradskyella sp. TaxID=1883156 RepID=UPI003BABF765
MQKQILDFDFEGVTLNGVLNLPKDQKPKGLVLIIHGSGRTNAVAQNWYADIRETIVNSGYATYMWDKMGCGQSGGTFNNNQSVYNSADEAIAAIMALKAQNIPGTHSFGLYGGSRGSWINPIIINQYKDIAFWISISGVDDKENFKYLLENNLRIAGMPKDSIALLANEWLKATKIQHSGGSFESAKKAAPNLSKNAFILRFNGGPYKEEDYYQYQETSKVQVLDEATGLPIVITDFDNMLSNINCPVLAIFGEKDMHVDWRKTKALYEKTLGKTTDLTIKSFPDTNHNLYKCKTGGFYEFQDHDLPWERPEGFLQTLSDWLAQL